MVPDADLIAGVCSMANVAKMVSSCLLSRCLGEVEAVFSSVSLAPFCICFFFRWFAAGSLSQTVGVLFTFGSALKPPCHVDRCL